MTELLAKKLKEFLEFDNFRLHMSGSDTFEDYLKSQKEEQEELIFCNPDYENYFWKDDEFIEELHKFFDDFKKTEKDISELVSKVNLLVEEFNSSHKDKVSLYHDPLRKDFDFEFYKFNYKIENGWLE